MCYLVCCSSMPVTNCAIGESDPFSLPTTNAYLHYLPTAMLFTLQQRPQ